MRVERGLESDFVAVAGEGGLLAFVGVVGVEVGGLWREAGELAAEEDVEVGEGAVPAFADGEDGVGVVVGFAVPRGFLEGAGVVGVVAAGGGPLPFFLRLLKFRYHIRIRMRPHHTTDDVMRIVGIIDPVTNGFIRCIL